MSIITTILTVLVALLFFYIMYLETFATDSDSTSRVFNIEKEELQRPNLNTLFKNQGIYNGLIGVELSKTSCLFKSMFSVNFLATLTGSVSVGSLFSLLSIELARQFPS